MSPLRKAACWALLYLGVAGVFAIVFGLTVLAASFLGLYQGIAVFCGLVAVVTALICALFAGQDMPAEEDEEGWGGLTACAPEGGSVVPFQGRVR